MEETEPERQQRMPFSPAFFRFVRQSAEHKLYLTFLWIPACMLYGSVLKCFGESARVRIFARVPLAGCGCDDIPPLYDRA